MLTQAMGYISMGDGRSNKESKDCNPLASVSQASQPLEIRGVRFIFTAPTTGLRYIYMDMPVRIIYLGVDCHRGYLLICLL